MVQTTLNNTLPVVSEAHISVGKDRQKVHAINSIYLNEGTEFELELFNPTQHPVQAKISVNGKLISQQGLIVKPGQRIFLERFIDVAKKFKFETYVIEAFEGVEKSIAQNGVVEISFYKEKEKPNQQYWYNNIYTYNVNSTSSNFSAYDWSLGDNHTITSPITSTSTVTYTSLDSTPQQELYSCSMSAAPKIETGRIEAGGGSNQSFTSVYMDFEINPSKIWRYQLLPNSQKPLEVADVVKVYCTNCGSKIKKKNWKFCAICGNKVE